jgi:lipid II isoglutaminyl synthase (glutamine-hydrolysing)
MWIIRATQKIAATQRYTTRLSARRAGAVLAAKLAAAISRALGGGGGTALPGLVATRLDPRVLRDLAAQLSEGSIVVTGTNGKTTTSRILGTLLSEGGYHLVRNAEGSNLIRGIASTLVQRADFTGNLSARLRRTGVFEIDEAALPEALQTIMPSRLVLLDLFRDQLDRYGEISSITRMWSLAFRDLPVRTTIVANADDPLIVGVADTTNSHIVYFGIQTAERESRTVEHAGDVKACPRCGGKIHYSAVFLGHLGHYRCDACGLARPDPVVAATNVKLMGVDGSEFRLVSDGTQACVKLSLPGIYNVYNALAAAAVAVTLGIDVPTIAGSLRRATPAFGRMERLEIDGREIYLVLAKNPAGFNEVLRTISGREPLHLLVMLNDNSADGRDVSWIWDVDIETLQDRVQSIVFAGTRSKDMALRFKYAEIIRSLGAPDWQIAADTESAMQLALKWTPPGQTLFVIPTYTALLDVREMLVRLGHAKPYWK